MMKKIIKISVLVLFVILVINGCKKGDNSPSNPYNGKTTAVFNTGLTYGTMTDQDGNIYKTITIGTLKACVPPNTATVLKYPMLQIIQPGKL
jgi:hypothetical protein